MYKESEYREIDGLMRRPYELYGHTFWVPRHIKRIKPHNSWQIVLCRVNNNKEPYFSKAVKDNATTGEIKALSVNKCIKLAEESLDKAAEELKKQYQTYRDYEATKQEATISM